MPECKIVIGAGYGDCGKGRLTDALTTSNTLVIRFNGGCQAGHTVQRTQLTPLPTQEASRKDELRHVFHHFGSGTLKKAPTFLSQHFTINPIMFRKEWYDLYYKTGYKPIIYADFRCRITTPFDMIINQVLETTRGDKRHGSTGYGINETVVRHQNRAYATSLNFIRNKLLFIPSFKEHLLNIQTNYVPFRCTKLGIAIPKSWQDMSMEIIDNYIADVKFFFENCTLVYPGKELFKDHTLLFEGAQGLRLDMNSPDFPHVTRSKTGLTNVLALLKEIDYKGEINVYYVTRPYVTRHGAGPLAHLAPNPPYVKVQDDTNLPNEWQGPLRYGWLDLPRLVNDINQDANQFKTYPALRHRALINMVITCIDHLDNDRIMFYDDENRLISSPLDYFIPLLQKCIPYLSGVGVSRSASSEDALEFYPTSRKTSVFMPGI
jgi:adenylosuccinate synthase